MADLTVFGYRSGNSVLHLLDARFKLICFVLISLSTLHTDLLELSLLTFGIVIVLAHMRLPVTDFLKALRYFFIFLLLVFITRALAFSEGLQSPIIQFYSITITRESLYEGWLICWRLMLVVVIGMIFISSTRPSEMKAAVQWYLIPVPFVPEKRVAMMMSLIIRFIPVIFNQAKEIMDAQHAKCIENRKNPVYRLVKFSVPLARQIFINADKLSFAMEARCYSEDRTVPELSANKKDWIALFGVICVSLLFAKI